jgi:hypothetical protein
MPQPATVLSFVDAHESFGHRRLFRDADLPCFLGHVLAFVGSATGLVA